MGVFLAESNSCFERHGLRRIIPILVQICAAKHLLKTSYKARQEVKIAQTALNLPCHKLFRDMPVRWNTSYFMIGRFLEEKSAGRVSILNSFFFKS